MTTTAALLLVLTLTGTPVASVMCGAVCQPAPAPTSHCHDDVAASDGPMVGTGGNCSEPSLSDAPYLVEHRATIGAAVLAATLSGTWLTTTRADAPTMSAPVPDRWLEPPPVLRL